VPVSVVPIFHPPQHVISPQARVVTTSPVTSTIPDVTNSIIQPQVIKNSQERPVSVKLTNSSGNNTPTNTSSSSFYTKPSLNVSSVHTQTEQLSTSIDIPKSISTMEDVERLRLMEIIDKLSSILNMLVYKRLTYLCS
jgi:hypothetical protein